MGVLDAYGQVAAGKARAAEYKAEAALAERQAQDVDLQAVQSSEQRREQLRASMAAIEARRAASGLSLDSGSAVAIENEVTRQAKRAEQIASVGFGNQKYALRSGAAAKRTSASNALTLGWINGAVSAGNTAAKILAAG